jgi:hypothetical protein
MVLGRKRSGWLQTFLSCMRVFIMTMESREDRLWRVAFRWIS